jgi:Tol biopolymer transport system component
MSLASGTKLGPYEIGTPLGAGGMGEVYRARDTRLDRTVAIKILPAQFTADQASKQRFEREAKTISSLNHPHICVLYDIGHQEGVDYIVMECVEGETLAKRLEKGPLPLDQTLKYGAQIAEALDKAHRSGIAHRDLKPSNIMLTPTGTKLLDFGLAKELTPLASLATLATAIATSPVTQQGTIVGTFQYMSPEQVEGKEVDGRSDLFSLGAVLYEMLTGKRAFEGKTQLSVASAILEREPEPLSVAKPVTPPALQRAIKRCLAKDPEERWQTGRDLAAELNWISEGSLQAVASETATQGTTKYVWAALAVALAAVLAAVFFWFHSDRNSSPQAVLRYTIPAPEGASFLFGGTHEGEVLSPDGRKIAFVARVGGVSQVWLQALDSFTAHPLAGTGDANNLIWSPDSQNLAFDTGAKLVRIPAAGGASQTVCELDGALRGGTWNRQDVILLGSSPGSIYRVSALGGTVQRATTLDSKRHDLVHRWPFFLPDGNHFLYVASSGVVDHESNAVFIGSLDGKQDRLLFHATSPVAYANGYLLYMSNQTLMARPFDAAKMEFTGDASSIAENVLVDQHFGGAMFSVSENGILLYQQGKPFNGYSLQVLDREGKTLADLNEGAMYFYPLFAPDGKRVAYHAPDPQTGKTDVYVWDIGAGNRSRLTFNSAYNRTPVWSPDGSRLAYVAAQSDSNVVFVRPANGIGVEEKSMELPPGGNSLSQWTPDGKYLLFEDSSINTRSLRIGIVPVEGNQPASTFMEMPNASVGTAIVSPDGRWLAFRSTETGKSEIYITSFPKPAGRIQISTAGGGVPRWRKDGKELFYLSPDKKLMAAELKESGGSLQVMSVRTLFQAHTLATLRGSHYDATADGTRFVFLGVNGDETTAPLNIVVNWTAQLKK